MKVAHRVKLSTWANAMGIPKRTAQRRAQEGTLDVQVEITDSGRYFVLLTQGEKSMMDLLTDLRRRVSDLEER